MQYNKNTILNFKTSVQAGLGAVENIFETVTFDQESITELENILIKNINSLALKIENNNQFELLTRFFNKPHTITAHITDLKDADKFELQKFIVEKISEDLEQIQNNQLVFTKSKFNKEKILKAIEIEKVKSQESYSDNFIEKVTLCKIKGCSSQKYHKDQNIKIKQKDLTLKITVKPNYFNNSRLEDLHNAFNTRGEKIKQISENEYEIWFAHYRINEIQDDQIKNSLYNLMENICDIHKNQKQNVLSNFVENIYNEFYCYKNLRKFYEENKESFSTYIRNNHQNVLKLDQFRQFTSNENLVSTLCSFGEIIYPNEWIDLIQKAGLEQPEFVTKYLEKIEQSNLKSEFIKSMDIIYNNSIDCQLNNKKYIEQENIEQENKIKNEFYETHIYGPEPSENISLLDVGKYIISQIMN